MAQFTILIVDDDPNIRKLLQELLGDRPDRRVLVAVDGKEAVRFFSEQMIDVVITDIHMPGFTGLEMIQDMQKINHHVEILVMTANGTPENVETARQVGARSILLKPFENLDIIEAEVDKAVQAVIKATRRGGGAQQTATANTELVETRSPSPKKPVTAATPVTPASRQAAAPARGQASQAPARPAGPAARVTPEPRSPARALPDAGATARFDLDEIEAFKAELAARGGGSSGASTVKKPAPMAAPVSPEPESPAPSPPARPAAGPAAGPAVEGADPGATPDSTMTARMEIPEIDAWKGELVGNEPPETGGFQARSGGELVMEEEPEVIPLVTRERPPAPSATVDDPSPARGLSEPAITPAPAAEIKPASPDVLPSHRVPEVVNRKNDAASISESSSSADAKPVSRGRFGLPDFSALKARLFGKGGPDRGGEPRPAGGVKTAGRSRPETPVAPAAAARPAASARSTTPAGPTAPAAPVMTGPPAAAVADEPPTEEIHPQSRDSMPSPAELPPEEVPQIPAELESIFCAGARLDAGKMKLQVPIVCLQTWEEQAAIAALRRLASTLEREFHTWSTTRGIVREDGQSMGETYRDPTRALEFIRRHKSNSFYVMADFRKCLEDRMVVRVLREMVMEGETARATMVLIAPVLPVPPELQPACASFDWPAAVSTDLDAFFAEVKAGIEASSGASIDIDPEMAKLLAERVRGMPAGRARFEIACALMARLQRGA